MKLIFRLTLLFLLLTNYIYAQQSSLPFENTDITPEKIMAGLVALAAYFIPSLMARDRIHFNYIFIFNVLLAWTIVGWFICFLWALWAKSKNNVTFDLDEDIDD